ncbi:hypothetical protein D7X55_21315 [Corallococcus sp. AB049A]|uniref:Lipoprotein n=1 Tax=Corallococcus interemptor TaxID=2316720 RepID=A0A3A8PW46_9BACT|nr:MULTISPECIES: hypothetical protein [Corallococcus]RKH52803.1 hypothetical protein D7Y23_05850 [Corallococcus sp. AB050B]RKH59141.1 hypothetical protein D7X96_35850 [Corallococcus interemptor]RKI63010.1 hypothetical protein D7X55_21315 [Corallococcus sp. AB049A]
MTKRAAAVLLWVGLSSGCAHYRVQAPGAAGASATEARSETLWSLGWGLVQERPRVDNCQDQALAEVTQSTNLGFALISVLTLGLAMPQQVEWRCAKAQPTPGDLGVLGAP